MTLKERQADGGRHSVAVRRRRRDERDAWLRAWMTVTYPYRRTASRAARFLGCSKSTAATAMARAREEAWYEADKARRWAKVRRMTDVQG